MYALEGCHSPGEIKIQLWESAHGKPDPADPLCPAEHQVKTFLSELLLVRRGEV